jgi:hypothetical protein
VLRQSSRPPERLPSKNASGRLNLRGRFSIPKLFITKILILTSNNWDLSGGGSYAIIYGVPIEIIRISQRHDPGGNDDPTR